MYSRLSTLLLFFIPFCFGIEICPTREITASSGRITSPGYPSNYPSNTDCTLTIRQPLDTKITFTFTKIDIEGDDSSSCYDTLDVIGLETKTFCATTTPAPYTSKVNVVKLKMVTDDSVHQTGFDLTFTTVKTLGLPTPVTVCPTREVTAGQVGRIMSPSFPENYGNNLNCKLTLKIPANKKTEISFDMFSIEYAGSCVNDKLLITSKGGQQKSACGTGTPASAVFEGDEVYVQFTTNGVIDNAGFMLSYKLINIPTSTCVCPDGAQYIKRTITKNNVIIRQDDDFSLDFKTTEANGLFLYAKGQVRDYILLKLENGNIVFEVDLGTGAATVHVTSGSLNDNAWHKVVVTRRGKSITVDVDDTTKAIATTPGSFSMLDIKGSNAALYALGGPSGNSFSSHNFKGCVRNLVVDDMKPIEAVQSNEADYALFGLSTLAQCSN